jgi:hypothetical protein
MARHVGLALALSLAGLSAIALAELPPGLPGPYGRPYTHVPVEARTVELTPLRHAGADTGVSTLHFHFVFDARAYDATYTASNAIRLPSDGRRFGDLRGGDTLQVWIDPDRPGAASLHRERRLGNDGAQILLGLGSILAAVAVTVWPRTRA